MNLNKLAAGMLGPPKAESDLVISPFLVLPVTLTAQIYYTQPGSDDDQVFMRFSTHAGEVIWAMSQTNESLYRNLIETLTLRVHVREEELRPVVLGVFREPIGVSWLGLQSIPEFFVDQLPAGVADEIRLNKAGKFAGDTP